MRRLDPRLANGIDGGRQLGSAARDRLVGIDVYASPGCLHDRRRRLVGRQRHDRRVRVQVPQRLAEIDCLARSDDLDVGDLAQRLVDAGRVRVARSDTDDPQTSHRTSPTDGVVGRP